MPPYAKELVSFLPSHNNLETFANGESGQLLIHSFDRTLIWLGLLRNTYGNAPGQVLLDSAHSKIIELWALVPLRLVHSASGALRTLMDLVYSYSFYVSHPKEWNAVCTRKSGWEGRATILQWHIHFTPCFSEYNKGFGIQQASDADYEDLSCFIHGIPTQGLPTMQSLNREHLDKIDVTRVIELAARTDLHLNLFLIGVFQDLLSVLPQNEYKVILAGIDKSKLAACGIALPAP